MTCCLKSAEGPEHVLPRVREEFAKAYGQAPMLVAVAPGRVNVIGEHVDYNGGWVLPAAIEPCLAMAVRSREDHKVRLGSANGQAPVEFGLESLSPEGGRDWGRYVRGVLAGLQEEGLEIPGFDAWVHSTIPIGGGLSSSAALEAATGIAVLALLSQEMDRMKLARICQKAEHVYAGVPCGIMDQAAILNCRANHLLHLDCESETFEQAPFDAEGHGLMIINSGVAHELASGEYALRRKACEDAAEILGVASLRYVEWEDLNEALENQQLTNEMVRCVRHVVTENRRTRRLVEALGKGDIALAGQLLNASHASLRDDYQVSCEELDFIAATALKMDGVAGCRMTGGGFGGSCVALIEMEKAEAVAGELAGAYEKKFGFKPGIFLTVPAEGAHVVRTDN